MRLRHNTPTERAGVNATCTLFESIGCVFQETDQRNDYGKDAYVDRGEDSRVTGFFVALQIKSGASYRRANGYAIPVDGHESVWRESPVPLAGIVFDPETGTLHWVNISTYLADHPEKVSVVPVEKEAVLDERTIGAAFWPSMLASPSSGSPVLGLTATDPAVQQGALLDCFAAARWDPRVLLIVRRLLLMFEAEPLRLLVQILALTTSHPDVYWTTKNWLPATTRRLVRRTFEWSDDEILKLLASAEYDELRRGGAGQNTFHILAADPHVLGKLRRLVSRGFDTSLDAGCSLVGIALHLAGDQAPAVFRDLVQRDHRVRDLGAFDELERLLSEFGELHLF